MSEFRLLIDGKQVPGAAELAVINPATEEVFVVAPRADRAQLDQAIASAKAAFPAWSKIPIRQRGALLVKLADAMEARKDEFIRLLTSEQGKPLRKSRWEVNGAIHHLRHVTNMDLPPRVLKTRRKGSFSSTRRWVSSRRLPPGTTGLASHRKDCAGSVDRQYDGDKARRPQHH
ncbi:aldehyde dehydrogenase family protein [Bradyrhizobium sp. 186]|uniref:aldehyde dehydrogenase family protein n=1 Tax=Bradyrhizobium sp. 186 TaxID=2782654 RepID=UPI002000F45D